MSIARRSLVATCVLVVACSGATLASPPSPPVDWRSISVAGSRTRPTSPPTDRERRVAEAYAAALMSPGLCDLQPRLAEGSSGSFCGSGEVQGRDQVAGMHELLFGAFDNRKFGVTRVLRTASAQALEWTMTGIQARDWMRVAATHRPVAFAGITLVWTRDDGAITDIHVYFDTAVVKGQLGAGPQALRTLPRIRPAVAELRSEQTDSPIEMENVAAVRSELDALESSDEIAYLSSMANDIEVVTPERSEPMRGKVTVRGYFESMHRAIGDLDTTIRNAWGIASFVVVEYSIAGVQLASIDWVPLRPDHVVKLHTVDVAELRDGRIARIRRYDNVGEIAEDLP
ncbi:MAG: nuclear transport factor 2 family protein [Polyangiaceae bacterium]